MNLKQSETALLKQPGTHAKRLAIAWRELPPYAARLIRAGNDRVCPIDVVATRTTLPIQSINEILDNNIAWIAQEDTSVTWAKLRLPVPDIFIQGGWGTASFHQLGKEVKNKGGILVTALDNCRKRKLRQIFAALMFRTIWHERFDGFWVPGSASKELLKFYGIPKRKIFTGFYGADPKIFVRGDSLHKRKRSFMYVGQLIRRKGLDLLADAVDELRHEGYNIMVDLFGSGELRPSLARRQGLVINDFLQSKEFARALSETQFLILPSREEHWGLVVHEATCCGCGLILSNAVGSHHDLLTEKNGWLFNSGNSTQLAQKMKIALTCSESRLAQIETESVNLSRSFGPEVWADSLGKICGTFSAFVQQNN